MSALQEAMSHAVLGWVKPELDQTLRLVRGEIESFAEHPTDTSRMHVCVGYLHQVQGTLRMVELYAPAMVAQELEKLAQALQDGQVGDVNEACATLMRGTVLLPDYLERLQSGHRDVPIVLMPVLNQVRAARGQAGLSESALFVPELNRPLPAQVPSTEVMAGAARDTRFAQAIEHLEQVLLRWAQDGTPAAVAALASALTSLQPLAQDTVTRRMLWVAVCVAEALRDGALLASPAVQQGFADLPRALRAGSQGDMAGAKPGQEPTRQLLYQVAQSAAMHPALEDLRKAFDLPAGSPSDAEIAHARSSISGRNRALLDTVGEAVKEELMRVKDALDLQLRTNEDIAGLAPQVAQLASVADTLGMMGLGNARNIVIQQRDALEQLVERGQAADEGALLDIAGSLLYVDASLDDEATDLGNSGAGRHTQVTEAQRTVEALAGEAIRNFAEARQQVVAFIETGWDHARLHGVPHLLDEVGGALRMLELTEPAVYLQGVRGYIGTELIQRRRVPSSAHLDTLADAITSLEYYLEALREHRPNGEQILVITRASLEALGYWPLPWLAGDAPSAAQSATGAPQASEQASAAAARAEPVPAQSGAVLEIERGPTLPEFVPVEQGAAAFDPVASEFDGPGQDEAAWVQAAFESSAEQAGQGQALMQDVTDSNHAMDAQMQTAPVAKGAVAADGAGSLESGFDLAGGGINDEIREVFLEEFDEEIDNLRGMLLGWMQETDSLDKLRPIRGVFHTLKGSGRLVGARMLSEFAWHVENMLNRVLDGSRPVTPAVVALLEQAASVLPQLNAALRGDAGLQVDLAGIEAIADRVACGEEAFYSRAGSSPVSTPEPEPVDEPQVAAAAADPEGLPASVDSVLREILEAEVATHLRSVDAWLARARVANGLAASEPLLRAFHTMNGAFAMADVPSITEVTNRAEQYIKRLLANAVQADADGVAGLAAASQAIGTTIVALQSPAPRIPLFMALREQLEQLRERLPQVARPISMVIDDHRQNTYIGQAQPGERNAPLEASHDPARIVAQPAITGQPSQPQAPDATHADADGELPKDGKSIWLEAQGEGRTALPWAETPATGAEASLTLDALAGAQQTEAELAPLDGDAIAADDTGEARVSGGSLAAEDLPVNPAQDLEAQAPQLVAQAAPEAEAQTPSEHVAEASEQLRDPSQEDVPAVGADTAAVAADGVGAGATADPETADPAQAHPDLDASDLDLGAVENAAAAQQRKPRSQGDAPQAAPGRDDPQARSDAVEVQPWPPVLSEQVQAPAPPAGSRSAPALPEQMLDFTVLDRDLVDIFVEEGNELLDHSDRLLARLRQVPDDRSLVIGLQRDLHTIKGGARMAGIEAIADLGHAIESLLEKIAEQRAEVDRGVLSLLERGFDVLHGMLARTAAYYLAQPQPELVAEFDARARGERSAQSALAPPTAATPAASADPTAVVASEVVTHQPGLASQDALHSGAEVEREYDRVQSDAMSLAAPSDAPAASFTEAPEQPPVPDNSAPGAVDMEPAPESLDTSQAVGEAATPELEQSAPEYIHDPAQSDTGAQDLEHDNHGQSLAVQSDQPPSEGHRDFVHPQRLAALDATQGLTPEPASDEQRGDIAGLPGTGPYAAEEAGPVAGGEPPVESAAQPEPVASLEPATQAPGVPAYAPVEPAVAPQPIQVLAPLSAPLDAPLAGEEESSAQSTGQEQVRIRADLLDQLVNQAGEVAIYRARLEQQMGAFRSAMAELDRTNTRLHDQLRRLDLETEAQIVARYQREQDARDTAFDPLELDRFSTLQQLSRALGESAADISGLQVLLDDLARQNDSLLGQQSQVSSELQDGLMRARMVPFDGNVPRLRRVLRQAVSDTGKQAQLHLEGAHGELDRNVLERMTAPLEHLLRNAVAHGLEAPQARREAGKPEEGTVRVALRREGSEMVVQVADDGAGIDHHAIRRRAEQRGLLQPGADIAEIDLERMILEPGFSTYQEVSQLAGRGVGLDVVHNQVRQLGGSLEIASTRGQGTTFTLRLPQTLAVTQAVFVQSGQTQFAVPVAAVSGIGRISHERFVAPGAVYLYAGEQYALHDLGTLVGQSATKAEGQPQVPLLLIRAGELRAAVAVDQVLGNREIVVKPVGPQIGSIPGIYGATITGDGSVVMILDAAPLVRRHIAQPALAHAWAQSGEQRHVPLVMVVDDSLTMRKVTSRVLERHNFEVSTARDGVEAMERLEGRVPDLMLLDIEMPRMDGYELTTAMRSDPRLSGVPIVMITSRTGDKHRQRALELGVQRYMGKPYQELDLMRNVYDLLGIARVRK